MAPIADDIREITAEFDAEPYWAGNGRDRPSSEDHNGFDCSGWDHFLGTKLAERGHYDGTYPVPLGSTSTYSVLARERDWLVPLFTAKAGTTVIYAAGGDPENSDGRFGHVGRVVAVETRDGVLWALTSESRGGQGVGLYWRRLDWWTIAYDIPDPSEEDFMATLTDDEKTRLFRAIDTIETLGKFKNEITTAGDLPWSGALIKIADLHRGWTAFKKGWKNSGAEPTDAELTKRVQVLRDNVAKCLKALRPAGPVEG